MTGFHMGLASPGGIGFHKYSSRPGSCGAVEISWCRKGLRPELWPVTCSEHGSKYCRRRGVSGVYGFLLPPFRQGDQRRVRRIESVSVPKPEGAGESYVGQTRLARIL